MNRTRLRGARTNNLQSVDLVLEPGTLVVVAGPSGAGKSSLAFQTLYAEGQRRFVESFSAYARQFLERLARPPVDELDPIPAAVSVDRQQPIRTSRSTVGTMTELTDYAKELWLRASTHHCPSCDRPIERTDPIRVADHVIANAADAKVVVTYPIETKSAEAFLGIRDGLVKDGYRRLWVEGEVRDLDELRPSEIVKDGVARVVTDRARARHGDRSRLVEAIEAAMRRGEGRADVAVDSEIAFRFSERLYCAHCERAYPEPSSGLFSFNSPIGACETCRGFGRVIEIDYDKVLPDPKLTLARGAVRPWRGAKTEWEREALAKHAKKAGIAMDRPLSALGPKVREWLIEGDELGYPKGWFGLRSWFQWMESRSYRMHVRVMLARYRKYARCNACRGTRLKPEALAYRIAGRTLPEFYDLPVRDALAFVRDAGRGRERDPATQLLVDECARRLALLDDVGLGYLTLDRSSRSLSGGEAQRVALTSALGASLAGTLFVLDEPTVGLHPRDVGRLRDVVRALVTNDNVAVVVEHDLDMIAAADRVVELGPSAGAEGGRIVFDGTPSELASAETATARAFRSMSAPLRAARTPREWIELRGASGHNLRECDAVFPCGLVTCVTGVSGSGKSSLVLETLHPAISARLGASTDEAALPFRSLELPASVTSIVGVDQGALGRSSRAVVASYVGAWDLVRRRFAREKLAKSRGYTAGFFSFNSVRGGRCETCNGEGSETVEMQFLADVSFTCPDCAGKRFVGPILDVKHLGMTIADALDLTVRQAIDRFDGDRDAASALAPLVSVGLGYLRLGQPLSTLSGGEAQRLKLAEAFRAASASGGTLLVLDEPTAGLHRSDIEPLVTVFHELAERGNTVVVVEHDMAVASRADHVIDLGPGPGAEGGRVVATGTPAEVAKSESATAPFLAAALAKTPTRPVAIAARSRPESTAIEIKGAREHNLRDVTVEIPREKLVAITGPSGSGKSTLAFDVLYAEGQRRYLETQSVYARQYLPKLPRPDVDAVENVPPSVSLEQRTSRAGANSTVATITEVAHYLRLLYAKLGVLHCPDCDVPVIARTSRQAARDLRALFPKRGSIRILAPLVQGKKGVHRVLLDRARQKGFGEARIDGAFVDLEADVDLDRYQEHDIDLVIGAAKAADVEPLLRTAFREGDGTALAVSNGVEHMVSERRACPKCRRGFPELDPRFFSFNTRQGQCPRCEGRGTVQEFGEFGDLVACPDCGGSRLSPLARAVLLDSAGIAERLHLSVASARRDLARIKLSARDKLVAGPLLGEIERRLAFLDEVGVGYLELDRAADTLSGGEVQRVRLAAQLGSGLTGVLYVLDEPTIGLHPRDTHKLVASLRSLVERGNSVLVVEHDADTIRAADHAIDVGPGGGSRGGEILARGTPRALEKDPRSITGASLARPAAIPAKRRSVASVEWLHLRGAREHNLKNVNLDVPLGRLTAVTGVSGSGKSTLVRNVLLRATRRWLGLVSDPAGDYDDLQGYEHVRRAVEVDQSPIGRTPRSVPATYTGLWDTIRELLAQTPEARARGYAASRFSFNVKGGRCDACAGQGALAVEMTFLPEVLVPCEVCGGARFNRETLEVRLFGKTAAEILDLEVAAARDVFKSIPNVSRALELMHGLGLDYLTLGQASSTLSGGEAQRLKLVTELTTQGSGPTLYVLDEPTTGLHRNDVARLLSVLGSFVERGDTLVVIEHHPDVILAADWVVDLGPEGGARGGKIVGKGTPEAIAERQSHTGVVLAHEIARSRPRARARGAAVATRPD